MHCRSLLLALSVQVNMVWYRRDNVPLDTIWPWSRLQ